MDDSDDVGESRLQTVSEGPHLWSDQKFTELSGKTPPKCTELPGTKSIKTVSMDT